MFATSNCAKIAELRRGMDPAKIFSIKISPSIKMVAVTSDKSTLHVFDLSQLEESEAPVSAIEHSEPSTTSKWGFLGRIPFLPRAFSDTYSFASARFERNDGHGSELDVGGGSTAPPISGLSGGRACKGVLSWLDDFTLIVVGAGRDGRWEKFLIVTGEGGKRYCIKDGWKRYLGR